jgi:N-acyl-D-aspartate/D-glutamate deacylase
MGARAQDHVAETAVRRLTFESASIFGCTTAACQPGMAADIGVRSRHGAAAAARGRVTIFPLARCGLAEPAQGIHMTVVNGQVLLEDGSTAVRCRVGCRSYYRGQHQN